MSPETLAARMREVATPDLEVQDRRGTTPSRRPTTSTHAIGGFLTPMLLALAGAALLVGAFIIFNTFSITVAQRTREFALLRALGSTRRQIVAAVAGEALILGVIASALGLLGGLGFARALGALFDAAGFGIPRGGMELAPRTIAVVARRRRRRDAARGARSRAARHPRVARRRRWPARPSRSRRARQAGALDRRDRLRRRACAAALGPVRRRPGDRPHGRDGRRRACSSSSASR